MELNSQNIKNLTLGLLAVADQKLDRQSLTLAADLMTVAVPVEYLFFTLKGSTLTVKVSGLDEPVVFQDIHAALAAYKADIRTRPESVSDRLVQIISGMKRRIEAAKQELPATAKLAVPLAIEVPLGGLVDLEEPSAFQAALARKLARMILLRHLSPSPEMVSFYLVGRLNRWQSEIAGQLLGGLGFVHRGSAVDFQGLVVTLVDAQAKTEVKRGANQITLSIVNQENAANESSMGEVLHEAIALAGILGEEKYFTKNQINDAEARKANGLGPIAQYHRRFMADPKQDFNISELYDVMRDIPTTGARFALLAFKLPTLKRIQEILGMSPALIRAVGAAA